MITSISTISGDLDLDKLIIQGEGEFGVVRKGWMAKENEENIVVAIRMLREYPSSEEITHKMDDFGINDTSIIYNTKR